jgi:hypothetical protein
MKTAFLLLTFVSLGLCYPTFYMVNKFFDTIPASNATGNWSQEVTFVIQTSDDAPEID